MILFLLISAGSVLLLLLLQVAITISVTWIVHGILYPHLGATGEKEDPKGCLPMLLILAGVILSILGWIWTNFLFWLGPVLLGTGIGLSHEWHKHIGKQSKEKQKAQSEEEEAKKKGRLY